MNELIVRWKNGETAIYRFTTKGDAVTAKMIFENHCGDRIKDIKINALEQQPSDSNISDPCDGCRYELNSTNGNPCYSCGKYKMTEQQPTNKCKGCYYNDGETHAECVVCDKKAQPSDADCISREAMLSLQTEYAEKMGATTFWKLRDDIRALPSVTPTNEDIKGAYLKGYDYGVKDWFKSKTQPSEDCVSREAVIQIIENKLNPCTDMFKCLEMSEIKEDVEHLPSVTPKYTDEEIDKAQAVEQAYVDKMVELAVEETKRPKGKWVYKMQVMNNPYTYKCSVCKGWEKDKTKYCPNCGAYMREGEEE